MERYYFADTIPNLLAQTPQQVMGALAQNSEFPVDLTQRDAWLGQIAILKQQLAGMDGHLFFEYSIPRMGRRVDVVALIGGVLFVIEFKVGESSFPSYALDQVMDYALDLKNFHERSHTLPIVPILICTLAPDTACSFAISEYDDQVTQPLPCNQRNLGMAISAGLAGTRPRGQILAEAWKSGGYHPTPTIVEAAMALYRGHNVADITRNDAGENITTTTQTLDAVIGQASRLGQKSICFVTGVPGAGKTLVGLNLATKHIDAENSLHSVFLSGNGPLVDILREALARDKFERAEQNGEKVKKGVARSEVKTFIQNVHHFRDDCLVDLTKPPLEHVVLFDEAQRAWNKEQTVDFMRRKKNRPDFDQSEPEFLISCMDRHPDWAVIVCLVGGGQEIHTGEAGIGEWLRAVERSFRHWNVYISPNLTDSEYRANEQIAKAAGRLRVNTHPELHLATSMRSFRAENVSLLVKQLLDLDRADASKTLSALNAAYPIVLTRDLAKAKRWVRAKARGSERYGLVVSSQAERLKPLAVDVRVDINPIDWFLEGKQHVRSSYYLEDVATEFQIQGLELDWACVIWDADLRFDGNAWLHRSFRGNAWQSINKPERQQYLKNAYRVLLTRARQGMVIVVPEGDPADPTRIPDFYDPTYEYLHSLGLATI